IPQRRAPLDTGNGERGAGNGVSGPAVTLDWPLPRDSTASGDTIPVPDVGGQNIRAAARMLHRAGFRVRIQGRGTVTATSPAAGTDAPAGSPVVIRGEVPGAR